MKTPQIENGFTKIADELLDALVRYRIPGEQMQCLLFIIRKTYGFNKKEDHISNSQFCAGTGLNKVAVCKAINKLTGKKVVTKNGNYHIPKYCFNKKYKEWKVLPKKVTVTKKGNGVTKKGNKLLPKMVPTKDNIQKIIYKRYIEEIFCCVISFLNSKTGKNFRLVESNKKEIEARINEGYLLEDLIQVIENQIIDPYFKENAKYLRPQTLFNKSKFSGYLENKEKKQISAAEETEHKLKEQGL